MSTNNNRDTAREVFWRFDDVYRRGHEDYIVRARRLEDLYLGAGRHWLPADRAAMEEEGRPCREVNTIFPTVNQAAGHQISSRVDINYLPKGGRADAEKAKTMSKAVKHSLENTEYRWKETEIVMDGFIQQRGYLDIRMDYEDNVEGEIKIRVEDPLDVIPDPDAKSYNPDDWADSRTCRWMTAREIESMYGKDAAEEVVGKSLGYCDEKNFGTEYIERPGFDRGMPPSYAHGMGWIGQNKHTRRYRIIDQQTNEYMQALVAIWPGGDFRIVEGFARERLAWMIDHGVQIVKRRVRRVSWQVAAPDVCFYDEVSPYNHITTIPFFPYFRRGQTLGIIDNMESPAMMLNKFVSQFEHVVNSSANSGWQGEADVLTNMTDDEFTNMGAQTGLTLLRTPGSKPFEKIQPNQVPNGIDRIIEFCSNNLNIVSGVDPNGMDVDPNKMSGIALQQLEYARQKKLAIANDNLNRTRKMVGDRCLELTQRFMGNERLINITQVDPYGREEEVPLVLNSPQEDGSILNDLTIGEFKIAVSNRPATDTFNDSEFEQIKAMRKDMGIAIPDPTVIRASNLADKAEIADAMEAAQGQADPNAQAEADLIIANTELAKARAVGENLKALYSAIQTAGAIVYTPESAAIADALAKSAGFVDKDGGPIIPDVPPGMEPVDIAAPGDTSPLTPADPASPAIGFQRGMTDSPDQPPAL